MKQIQVLLVSVVTCLLGVAASAQSWTNGLTSYFPFDGNAVDIVGGYNGSASNVVLTSNRFQAADSAYLFDGTDSAVLVPPAIVNNLAEGTLAAWVYLDDNTQGCVFVKQADGANTYALFSIGIFSAESGGPRSGDAGRMYFHSQNGYPSAASTSLVSTGAWHQVVVTFSPTNCIFYLDGAAAGSTAGDFSIPDNNGANVTAIGAWATQSQPISFATLDGALSDFRVFNRALQPGEVAQIYSSEEVPPGPRTAIAIAQVVNGFVVGVQIVDSGYGYTNVPSIRFIGVGSGAQAAAVVSNSAVVAINIVNPGSGYATNGTVVLVGAPIFNNPVLAITRISSLSFTNLSVGSAYELQQLVNGSWVSQGPTLQATNAVYSQTYAGVAGSATYRLVLYPIPVPAQAIAQVINGFVVGAQITNPGSGYVTNPLVTIVGGGGSNAVAVSQISNGSVSKISLTSAGSGYTSPTIQIAPPPVPAILPQVQPLISINSSQLVPYENYQLQVSSSLGGTWAPVAGGSFLSTNANGAQLLPITNGTSLFRLQSLP